MVRLRKGRVLSRSESNILAREFKDRRDEESFLRLRDGHEYFVNRLLKGVRYEMLDDIRELVWYRVWRYIGTWYGDAGSGNFRGWLSVLVRHSKMDYMKSMDRERGVGVGLSGDLENLLDGLPVRCSSSKGEEDELDFEFIMELLPPGKVRDAFYAEFVEGKPMHEVLGVSRGAASVFRHRWLKRLREFFETVGVGTSYINRRKRYMKGS